MIVTESEIEEWYRQERLDTIRCPRDLNASEEAKKEWDRVAPLLYDAGILTILDRPALTLYCMTYSVYAQALKGYQESGEKACFEIAEYFKPLVRGFAKEFFL